jgi:hypothetical protein
MKKRTSENPAACPRCGVSGVATALRIQNLEHAMERLEELVRQILANQYPAHLSGIERR